MSHESMEPPTDAEAFYFAAGSASDGSGNIDIEALCQQRPDLAAELRDIDARWQRFQSALGQLPTVGPETPGSRTVAQPGSGASEGPSSELLGKLSGHRPPQSRYQLQGKIAQGGMGAILKVWDEPLQRDLAMKVMLSNTTGQSTPADDERLLSRFLEEALVTGQLDHPGVVPVHELGVDENSQVYFTMRLVKGTDLKAVFALVENERDGWNLTRALGTVLRACEALAYAHSKGVIHRDLKPANIMVGLFGEVYVMDWGLAKVNDRRDQRDLRLQPETSESEPALTNHRNQGAEQRRGSALLTMDGAVIGTPTYMSPEQARGQSANVDARSDVYAMGAILYELLTGLPPYARQGEHHSPREILESILSGPPRALSELGTVPPELEAICERAMARRHHDRYRDVAELAEDLRAYLEHRVVSAYETGAVAELKKWVVRNKALAASLVSVVMLVLVGGGVFAWQNVELTHTVRARDDALAEATAQETLAHANAEQALANARVADANAAEALANSQRAEAERANVLRLSAFQELVDLQREANALWPATPDLLPAYDAWLIRAQALLAGLEPSEASSDLGHRAQLAILSQRALPQTSAERDSDRLAHPAFPEWEQTRATVQQTEAGLASFRKQLGEAEPSAEQAAALAQIESTLPSARERLAALESEISRRQTYSFSGTDDTWWHNQLTKLIDDIEAFADPQTGLIEGQSETYGWSIARRREFAAMIGEQTLTSADARERWEQATGSIADPAQCPTYNGLRLTPQLGLLPLGRDSNSGLWEFWHIQSGDEPSRGEDGALQLTESSGMVMVLIPGGSFWMGAQNSEPDDRNYDPLAQLDEGPVHEVILSPYFLSKYEMTQGQWTSFTGSNPSGYEPERYSPVSNRSGWEGSYLHSVEQVSWSDCLLTLSRLGLTLPTEARWENACRARTSTPFWSGREAQSLQGLANLADQYAKTHGYETLVGWEPWLDDGQTIHARVGSYRANGFGLHDTHGNVWEWCLDDWDVDYYARSPSTDPLNTPFSGHRRVFRGGCFELPAQAARSSRRGRTSDLSSNSLGLRAALDVQP